MPKKALALVESPTHVCCRYRIRAFESALNQAGWSLEIAGLSDAPLWKRLGVYSRVHEADAVILQRKLLSRWEFKPQARSARRLIFDFDDAVLYRDSNDPRGPRCRRRARRFARTVRGVDLIIAGNRFLADCAIESGAARDRVMVVPTTVAAPPSFPARRAGDSELRLCWIGSSSTLRGLEKRSALWRSIGETMPNVRLRVICDRFPDFSPLRVENVPWSEAVEREALETSDVGISWTPDDLWSRGKCGLKLLQYQAAGLPAIANPVGVHPDIIQHGVNGFLAESDEEWRSAVAQLANDPGLRARMGRAAWESVRDRYSIEAWSDTFVKALEGPSIEAMSQTVPHSPARRPESLETSRS